MAHLIYLGNVAVAGEFPVLVIISRREGHDVLGEAHQVLGLTGKEDAAGVAVAVVQGTDPDGVPGGNELICGGVVEDHGKLRVQHGEHLHTVLLPERQQQFTVAAAAEGITLGLQVLFHLPEPVQFPVAHHSAAVRVSKGLHALRLGAHDGQAVEHQHPAAYRQHTGIVRSAALSLGEGLHQLLHGEIAPGISHNSTHKKCTSEFSRRLKFHQF